MDQKTVKTLFTFLVLESVEDTRQFLAAMSR
jgi:hypothetical protein